MSISTPAGDRRRPSVVSTDKKPPAGGKPKSDTKSASGRTTGGKSGGEARPAGGGKSGGGARPAGGGKSGRPRKPIKPVKVTQGRNWGPIALFVAVGLIAVAIVGFGAWTVYQNSRPLEQRAEAIDGVVNYRKNPDKSLTARGHAKGPLTYKISPPVGGTHNFNWQNCMGDVYDAPIANEHAVHSMEHGAVWITYRSGLPKDQVEKLASKVRGNEYMLMSPVDNLDSPISVQAWGFQLKVKNADDSRIDEFVKVLRKNAAAEPGASCSGGITATGTTPHDVGGGMQ